MCSCVYFYILNLHNIANKINTHLYYNLKSKFLIKYFFFHYINIFEIIYVQWTLSIVNVNK